MPVDSMGRSFNNCCPEIARIAFEDCRAFAGSTLTARKAKPDTKLQGMIVGLAEVRSRRASRTWSPRVRRIR
jgi:hypothetical protein